MEMLIQCITIKLTGRSSSKPE